MEAGAGMCLGSRCGGGLPCGGGGEGSVVSLLNGPSRLRAPAFPRLQLLVSQTERKDIGFGIFDDGFPGFQFQIHVSVQYPRRLFWSPSPRSKSGFLPISNGTTSGGSGGTLERGGSKGLARSADGQTGARVRVDDGRRYGSTAANHANPIHRHHSEPRWHRLTRGRRRRGGGAR